MRTSQTGKTAECAYDEWAIRETVFNPQDNLRNETLFSIGNGYIGLRGSFEEKNSSGHGNSVPGTYLNGFFDKHPIQYGERHYGYAQYSETMLNVADCKPIELFLGTERFQLGRGRIVHYERTLDFKSGRLIRTVTWESPSGKRVLVRSQRMAHLQRQHLVVFSYEVTPLNFNGEITLASGVNGDVRNQAATDDPRVGSSPSRMLVTEEVTATDSLGTIRQRTLLTKLSLVCAVDHQVCCEEEFILSTGIEAESVQVRYVMKATQGKPIRLTKVAAYYTSRDASENALMELAQREVAEGKKLGFEKLAMEQEAFLQQYWETSDVEIDGDNVLQQGIRFNAFHLLQSVGRNGKTNIAAKGLTGEGYSGHYFWDSETYILPFFLYTHPEISRRLLEYRYQTLDKARQRAKELSHRGALYPWRTIDGEETSAYYPAGTAQYHINADIAHAIMEYFSVTNDRDFLVTKGAEILFETARFWVDLGDFIPSKDNLFCINDVTGPDEYTCLVNNNFYTNLMAKVHLESAVSVAHWLESCETAAYRQLSNHLGLTAEEIFHWNQAAEKMYLPYEETLAIRPQDDSFLSKARWDFEHTPPEKYPLLLHYHPLEIYRHQVLKQPDVILAMLLQNQSFSQAEKKRNFDYYDPITTHDSSLSPCICGIVATELGYSEKAYDYFLRTARMDLDDYNGNVKDGVHTAAMAGTWLFVVYGFAGMRQQNGLLYFRPTIPGQWKRYQFQIKFQGRLLKVGVEKSHVIYTLVAGQSIRIHHLKKPVVLQPGKPQSFSLKRKLEAVIFDLDGVITNTSEYHYRAWKRLAEENSLPFDRNLNERLKGIGRLESLEIILNHAGFSRSAAEKARLAAQKNEYYRELLQQITPGDLLPGIHQLLVDLKDCGIKIGLASASKNAPEVINKLQIDSFFDTIVDVKEIRVGKPDPEIFMTAAEHLEVPYGNCAGIEDAPTGIESIREAGMFAVGVALKTNPDAADWPVPDTSHITYAELAKRMSSK